MCLPAESNGLEYRDCLAGVVLDHMADEVRRGLSTHPKSIPSKYFYDARGSALFEEICSQPEYYPTRTELSILRTQAKDLTRGLANGDLIELGSGSNRKIRILFDAMSRRRRATVRYVPVDVSDSALLAAGLELRVLYPELAVAGVVADFTRDLNTVASDRPKVVLLLGSTIGNFDEEASQVLVQAVARILNPGDRFVLGLDLLKPIPILEAAYNDSKGLTAEFNKNVLRVMNRELAGDFDPENFEHHAFFNPEHERIEMHLRAKDSAQYRLDSIDLSVTIAGGESIHTEICRKFSRASAERLVQSAGLRVQQWYTDPGGWFAVVEAVPNRGKRGK